MRDKLEQFYWSLRYYMLCQLRTESLLGTMRFCGIIDAS